VHEPCELWREVTSPKEIEQIILERNKRHLQQASIEDGRIHNTVMQDLISRRGTSDLIEDLRNGRITLDAAVNEAIQAYIQALIITAGKPRLAAVTGLINVESYQGDFKSVSEMTTSSPSGLHYSIWKVLAKEDDIAKWQSAMMSLPFMYGFAHRRWTKLIGVMLEKKRGIKRIHLLRIIGILEADFNVALKILFARKLMFIAEQQGISTTSNGALEPIERRRMLLCKK